MVSPGETRRPSPKYNRHSQPQLAIRSRDQPGQWKPAGEADGGEVEVVADALPARNPAAAQLQTTLPWPKKRHVWTRSSLLALMMRP